MIRPLYEMKPLPPRQQEILETMRKRCAQTGMGVTLVGNRLTLRWNDYEDQLVEVHMIIEHVEDGLPDEQDEEEANCQ